MINPLIKHSPEQVSSNQNRLLLFNLMTDADDSVLGFTTAWINAFALEWDHVDVLTMYKGRLDTRANVNVLSVGRELGLPEWRRLIKFYLHLFRLLSQNRYQACFAHMMPIFSLLASPVLRVFNVPIVLWFTHKSKSIRLRLAEKVVHQVVTASAESFRIPSKKIIVVGHGIDTNLFSRGAKRDQDLYHVIAVGRISPIKRFDLVIDAVAKFQLANPKTRVALTIVGDVAEKDLDHYASLQKLISKLDLNHVVNFSGPKSHDELVTVYQSADVMLHTSETGSVDKVVLEALSCGCLVLTTSEPFRSILGKHADLLWCPAEPGKLAERLGKINEANVDNRLRDELRQIVLDDHDLTLLVRKISDILIGSRFPKLSL